jgi:plasmid stabilization system protein ParE
VARLAVLEEAWLDLDRLAQFLHASDPDAAAEVGRLVFEGLAILERHPLVGRPAEAGLRELVISRGKSGYVALYEFREAEDLVLVLALRHQRESGFAPG